MEEWRVHLIDQNRPLTHSYLLLCGPDSLKSLGILLDIPVNNSDDDARQLLAGSSAYRHGGPGAEAIIAITSSMIFITI
jgi:hypothetical protein